jgi:hypothetical protein
LKKIAAEVGRAGLEPATNGFSLGDSRRFSVMLTYARYALRPHQLWTASYLDEKSPFPVESSSYSLNKR